MQEQTKLLAGQEEHKGEARFQLPDKHRTVAEEIVKKNITKRYLRKGCKRCKLTGVSHITDENTVKPCSQCVNLYPARLEWNEYCKKTTGLKRWILDE